MKRRFPRNPLDRPLTAEDLARYLFGDQMDPNDTGLIGRMIKDVQDLRTDMNTQVKIVRQQVRGVLLLGWAILLALIAALLSFLANVLLHYIPTHVGP